MTAFENRQVADYLLRRVNKKDPSNHREIPDSLFYPIIDLEMKQWLDTDQWFAEVTAKRLSKMEEELASEETFQLFNAMACKEEENPTLFAAQNLVRHHFFFRSPERGVIRELSSAVLASPRRPEAKRLLSAWYKVAPRITETSPLMVEWQKVEPRLHRPGVYNGRLMFKTALEKACETLLLAPFVGINLDSIRAEDGVRLKGTSIQEQEKAFMTVMDQYFDFLGEEDGQRQNNK